MQWPSGTLLIPKAICVVYLHVHVIHHSWKFRLTLAPLHYHFSSSLQRIPKWVDMAKDGAQKLPESLWKLAFYTITWIWAIYLIATEDYFFDLQSHWNSEPLSCTCTCVYLRKALTIHVCTMYMQVQVSGGRVGRGGLGEAKEPHKVQNLGSKCTIVGQPPCLAQQLHVCIPATHLMSINGSVCECLDIRRVNSITTNSGLPDGVRYGYSGSTS